MLISAGAAVAQSSNQQAAESRRQKELEAAIRQNQAKQREADALVNREIQKVAVSSPEADRVAANEDFLSQLRRAKAGQVGDAATDAVAGDDYNADVNTGTSNVIDFGKKQSDIASRIAAPGRQRMREGFSGNRLNTQIGRIAREASGNDFLTQLRLRAIQPNPWVDAAANVGQGIAGGMASSGYGVDKTPTWSQHGSPAWKRNNFGYN